jgi:hypothetical protein
MDSMLFGFLSSRRARRQRSGGAAAKEENATRLSSNLTGSALIVSAGEDHEEDSDVEDDFLPQNLSEILEDKNFEVDAEAMIDTPGSLAKEDDTSTSTDPQSPMTMVPTPPQTSPGRRVSIGIPSKLNIPSASLFEEAEDAASPRHSRKLPTERVADNEIQTSSLFKRAGGVIKKGEGGIDDTK